MPSDLISVYSAPLLLPRREGWLPLHLAANVGRTACVDALLAREGAGMLGAPNEAPGIRCGWTPLHCAAKQGRVAMVGAWEGPNLMCEGECEGCGDYALLETVCSPYRSPPFPPHPCLFGCTLISLNPRFPPYTLTPSLSR